MIARVLNFFFVGLAALSCLALYRVSENTRAADMKLRDVDGKIAKEEVLTSELQAEWQRVANPRQIERLAQSHLGSNENPAMELSSFDMLPRRGEANPLSANPVQNASVTAPGSVDSNFHLVVATGN